jgi:hypothetical protein
MENSELINAGNDSGIVGKKPSECSDIGNDSLTLDMAKGEADDAEIDRNEQPITSEELACQSSDKPVIPKRKRKKKKKIRVSNELSPDICKGEGEIHKN